MGVGRSSVAVVSISSLRLSSSPQTFLRSAAVGVVALTLGVLTAFAQEWLPTQLHSLANSAASWALIAFALSFLATTAPMSAIFGCVSLLGMELGYVLEQGCAAIRHLTHGSRSGACLPSSRVPCSVWPPIG